jgi:hypothetical protein
MARDAIHEFGLKDPEPALHEGDSGKTEGYDRRIEGFVCVRQYPGKNDSSGQEKDNPN